MRLREIANLIREVDLSALNLEVESASSIYKLSGLISYRDTVNRLNDVPAFEHHTRQILSSS